MIHCPEQDCLERLLNGRLGDGEQAAVEHHVEVCPRCQEALVERAGPLPWSEEAPAWLRASPRAAEANGAETTAPAVPPVAPTGPPASPKGLAADADGAGPPVEQGGRQVGDYDLVEVINQGGMGVVYRAWQRSPRRWVAVKMIRADRLDSPAAVRRFYIEAEAVAQLEHPHIVPIYEVGKHEGQHYFSMKLCLGGDLGQHLSGLRKDLRAAARLLASVACAVQCTHDHGILHRDLKPANILLDDQGQPRVTDFGLAKKLDDTGGLTHTGEIMGTPNYMAPEQAAGEEATPATDVYALGAVLYEVLAGRPPFQAETSLATLLTRVRESEPDRPRALNPAAPRDLETICLRAMAKETHRRYPSARALAEELERFANDQPIQTRRPGWLERLWRCCRRNRGVAGLSAVAGGLLAAVVVLVSLMLGTKPSGARDSPLPKLSATPDGSFQRVKRVGKVVVATDPTYPPLEFLEDGALAGFGIELARRLAHRLGVEVEFVEVGWDWPDLVARLNALEFDMVLSTVTITEERLQQVDFVEYLRMPVAFVCKPGVMVESEHDLPGKVVAVQDGTAAEKLLDKLKIRNVRPLPGTAELLDAVRDSRGEVQVALTDQPVARYYALRDPVRLKVTGSVGDALDPDPVGIAFRKQDRELRDAVAEAIKGMKQQDDGSFAELKKKWFGR